MSRDSMVPYSRRPDRTVDVNGRPVAIFDPGPDGNVDAATLASFGVEWTRFEGFDVDELHRIGSQEYFDLLGDDILTPAARVLDVGCGSGRWIQVLAPRVGCVDGVDPSDAVFAAATRLAGFDNVRVAQASVSHLPFEPESFDLVLSLGVLHHVPDTAEGIGACAEMVRPGGYFLVYLYYAMETRSALYRALWRGSDLVRRVVSRFPRALRVGTTDAVAALAYLPLARLAAGFGRVGLGGLGRRMPLAYYADKSFYIMRNDAYDRFATPLEKRFTRHEIREMLESAGLTDVRFSEGPPYWHALARKPA